MNYNFIRTENKNNIYSVILNRPEKRNALHPELIEELTHIFKNILQDNSCRVVLIAGAGKSFCAGADIEWLHMLKDSSKEEIVNNFGALATMLQLYFSLPQITISKVHGSVYGGGMGLLAASDFVIAAENTKLSFSEINIGMVPSTISPFVMQKTGLPAMKKLFYSGEVFTSNHAMNIGLVDQISTESSLDSAVDEFVQQILSKPVHATREMKKLIHNIQNKKLRTDNCQEAAFQIAEILKGEEANYLFEKFLSKK